MKETNKSDHLLTILIILQIFGGLGGALQPIRLFVILILPYVLRKARIHKSELKIFRFELQFFVLWILWGILTLFRAENYITSIKEIFYLTINAIVFYSFIVLAIDSSNVIKSIIRGWLFLFILTIPIALLELTLDIHLPTAYQEEVNINIGDDIFNRHFSAVTYGNLNGYNTILVYILPFLVSLHFVNKTNVKKILFIVLQILFIYILFSNGSRGATICLLLAYVVLLTMKVKNKALLIGIFTISPFIILFLFLQFDFFKLIGIRFAMQGFNDDVRSSLINNSILLFKNSYFLGVGAGNLMPLLSQVSSIETSASHSLFLEILVQYGLIIFILFISIFLRITLRIKNAINRQIKFILLYSIISLIMVSTIDSNYILSVNIWIYLSSLIVLSSQYIKEKERLC